MSGNKEIVYYFQRKKVLPIGWLIGRREPLPELDNKSLIDELVDLIRTKSWTVITGPRLVGKTTFARSVARHLRNTESYEDIYVNVSGINDFSTFVLKTYQEFPKKTKLLVKKEYGDFNAHLGISSKGPYGEIGGNFTHPRDVSQSYLEIVLDFMLKNLPNNSIVIWDEVQDLGKENLKTLLNSLWRVYNEIEDEDKVPEIIITGSSISLLRMFLEPAEEDYENMPFVGREFESIALPPWDRKTFENYVESGFDYYKMSISRWELNNLWDYSGGLPGVVVLYGWKRCAHRLSHDKAIDSIRKSQLSKVRAEIFRLIDWKFPKAKNRLKIALKEFAKGTPVEKIIIKSKTSKETFYDMLRLLEENGYVRRDKDPEGKNYEFSARIYEDAILSWRGW